MEDVSAKINNHIQRLLLRDPLHSTHSNEVLDASVGTGRLKSHTAHVIYIPVSGEFKTMTRLSVKTGWKCVFFYSSDVIHVSGDINSSVEQSYTGSEIFREEMSSILSTR